jgi:hypothetical protein
LENTLLFYKDLAEGFNPNSARKRNVSILFLSFFKKKILSEEETEQRMLLPVSLVIERYC